MPKFMFKLHIQLAPPQIEVACLNTCNPNDEMTIETFNNAQNNAKLEAKESPLTYGYVNESVVNEDVVLSPTYQVSSSKDDCFNYPFIC